MQSQVWSEVAPPSSCRKSPVDMHPAAAVGGRRRSKVFFSSSRAKAVRKKLLLASRLKCEMLWMGWQKKKVAGQPLTARDRQALETFSSAPSSPFVSPEQPQFSFTREMAVDGGRAQSTFPDTRRKRSCHGRRGSRLEGKNQMTRTAAAEWASQPCRDAELPPCFSSLFL